MILEDSPYRLLVEGLDDQHSVLHLMARHDCDWNAWLAWQERPGIPFGIALQAQVFRHDTGVALRFVAWFKRLFVDA